MVKGVTLPSQNTTRIIRQSDPDLLPMWTWVADDIISDVVRGGSNLMRWVPSRPAINPRYSAKGNVWKMTVTHLAGVFGAGFTGETTYFDHLTEGAGPLEECDFGEGGMDIATFEYEVKLGRVSTSNKGNTLRIFDGGGIQQYAESPIPRYRGDNAGIPLTTDVEVAVALLGMDLEDFLNWNFVRGNSAVHTKKGGYDGLDAVLSKGWVANRVIGHNPPAWSDPEVVNGANITTAKQLLRAIELRFWTIYNRMRSRGHIPRGDDIVVTMPEPFWRLIARIIARGYISVHGTTDVDEVSVTTTPEVIDRVYERITNYNDQYAGSDADVFAGFIPFANYNLPVIVEDSFGSNSITIEGGEEYPSVTGDVMVLSKSFRGFNVLEHLYLDWTKVPLAVNPYVGEQPMFFQNGMIRAKWVPTSTSGECFFLAMDMYAMFISRMQPLQAKILDVTLRVDEGEQIEAGRWTHPNFYLLEGQTAGTGNPILIASNRI